MALRFADSFDHWLAPEYSRKWTSINRTDAATVGGRFGGLAFTTFNRWISKAIDYQQTWIVGAAVLGPVTAWPGGPIFWFGDGTSTQCELRYNGSVLYVTRAGTQLGPSVTHALGAVWTYIEFKVTIDNAAGAFDVIVDGENVLSGTGYDTQATGTAAANTINLGTSSSGDPGPIVAWDDLYVCDTSGSAPTNDFLGDVRVECLYPGGDGNSSDFLGSDGNSVNNYLLEDETYPDDDTTYVGSPDVGDKDTYAYGNLATVVGSVYGVQILPCAKKTDAGARSIATVARLGTTEENGPDQSLSSGYLYKYDIRELDPDGNPWTIANVNASEFGVEVTA